MRSESMLQNKCTQKCDRGSFSCGLNVPYIPQQQCLCDPLLYFYKAANTLHSILRNIHAVSLRFEKLFFKEKSRQKISSPAKLRYINACKIRTAGYKKLQTHDVLASNTS